MKKIILDFSKILSLFLSLFFFSFCDGKGESVFPDRVEPEPIQIDKTETTKKINFVLPERVAQIVQNDGNFSEDGTIIVKAGTNLRIFILELETVLSTIGADFTIYDQNNQIVEFNLEEDLILENDYTILVRKEVISKNRSETVEAIFNLVFEEEEVPEGNSTEIDQEEVLSEDTSLKIHTLFDWDIEQADNNFKVITNVPNYMNLNVFKQIVQTNHPSSSYQIFTEDGETLSTFLVTGDKLVVTAEDNSFQETYIIILNDIYNFTPEYTIDVSGKVELVEQNPYLGEWFSFPAMSFFYDYLYSVITLEEDYLIRTMVVKSIYVREEWKGNPDYMSYIDENEKYLEKKLLFEIESKIKINYVGEYEDENGALIMEVAPAEDPELEWVFKSYINVANMLDFTELELDYIPSIILGMMLHPDNPSSFIQEGLITEEEIMALDVGDVFTLNSVDFWDSCASGSESELCRYIGKKFFIKKEAYKIFTIFTPLDEEIRPTDFSEAEVLYDKDNNILLDEGEILY